jgi:trimethylamine:corrinoid methyltransferase-like protein
MKYLEQNQTLSRIYKKIREISKERKELKRQENLQVLKEIGDKLKSDKEYQLYKKRGALKTSLNSVKTARKSYSGLYKLYVGHKVNK